MRFGFAFLLLLVLQVPNLQATVTSHQQRKLNRFRNQCDNEGSGKACYDYGRALWSTLGAIDRKTARKYLLRGCQLKYEFACKSYNDYSVSRVKHHKYDADPQANENRGNCFNSADLEKAQFAPNLVSQAGVRGQKIRKIQSKSFWFYVGLKEGDVLVKVNNEPVNTQAELKTTFSHTGKKFGFEILRDGGTTTLWYNCQ